MADYILSTADYSREDRLWPAHYSVFTTNPLSIAYGACGIAAFLQGALGDVPAETRQWIRRATVTPRDYPPGLLVGMAGIAYQLQALGMDDDAQEVMASCYRSPLLFEDPTMFLGVAGWGLVSLFFYKRFGDRLYLDKACEACDHLLLSARTSSGMLHWPHAMDGETHFGYGYGASGISLFLLRAGAALGHDAAVSAAQRALKFDLANRIETGEDWSWPHYMGGQVRLPYWAHGAVGVGTAAARLGNALGDRELAAVAEGLGNRTFLKWTILPSQLYGLAGIGEFMLDMHLCTDEREYLLRAGTIAETILWYAVERPNGIIFPGRWHSRFSTDYATGSAGIGMFFLRLLEPGPRYLVDLDSSDLAISVEPGP